MTRIAMCIGPLAATGEIAVAQPAYRPDPMVTFLHLHDPEVDLWKTRTEWQPEITALWLRGLQGPESDLRREAADAMRQAHEMDWKPTEEIVKALATALSNPAETEITRTALAAALVAFDAKQHAELLFSQAQQGPTSLAVEVEPALAKWNYEPIKQVWLERLSQPADDYALLKLAIEMVGEMRLASASSDLERLTLRSKYPATLRMAAAKSLARCQTDSTKLLSWARQMLESPSETRADAIVGVLLLAHQEGPAVESLLENFADRDEPIVVGLAVERLTAIAPQRVVARAADLIQHRDSRVRFWTIRALQTAPTNSSTVQLLVALNDSVLENRQLARQLLLEFANDESLSSDVIEGAKQVLASDQWRSLEQAILLLTKLERHEIGDRLFELLQHDRPGVHITAAWSLKTLAIDQWKVRIGEHVERIGTDLSNKWERDRTQTLTHLIEAVGITKHQASRQFLIGMVPKAAPYEAYCRGAAIWALGYIDEGTPDAGLVNELKARLADGNSTPPEAAEVRAASALALGRMGSPDALDSLRRYEREDGEGSFVGRRCSWAIEQIDGTAMPVLVDRVQAVAGWFLQPLPIEE